MTIYKGKSADGSDMYPVQGAFVSPDGKEWSNKPYTKQDKMYQELYFHLSKNQRFIEEEFELILNKQSTLSSRLRDYVKHLIENNK
jgi:hypothetical protein